MTKFILFLSGLIMMYSSVTGKLKDIWNIKEPLAEVYICILGFLMVCLSVFYFTNQNPGKNG